VLGLWRVPEGDREERVPMFPSLPSGSVSGS
jgi:hypothetical protein